MKYNTSQFLDKLIAHEGMVLTVYQDTLGIDTIGIGRNLKDRGISKEELDYMDIPSMAIVYEHGITEADARYLAMNDIKIVEDELCRVHPCVNDLDAVRQLILMDMAFNMGVPRLCKFKRMWNAIHEGHAGRWIASIEDRRVLVSGARGSSTKQLDSKNKLCVANALLQQQQQQHSSYGHKLSLRKRHEKKNVPQTARRKTRRARLQSATLRGSNALHFTRKAMPR